jgi:hypothetical protein
MLDHCPDDIGVVDLTAAAAMGNQEVKEAVEHSRPILGNLECGAKGLHICDRGRHGQGWRACLGSRHDSEIFSEHLGLTHRVDPSPSNLARAADATACCGADGRVAYTRTFVSTKTGSPAIVAVHILAS